MKYTFLQNFPSSHPFFPSLSLSGLLFLPALVLYDFLFLFVDSDSKFEANLVLKNIIYYLRKNVC